MKRQYKKINKKINKKGFTMVELLAVILILGILMTVSIVAIQNILVKAKERYYVTQEDNMQAAARSYVEKNTQYRPKVSGQIVKISLDQLIDSKYISEVVDYSKGQCSYEESYVQIFNYQNEYSYVPYLKCPVDGYETSLDEIATEYNTFTVSITGETPNPIGSFTIKETKEGIYSYSYVIYKDDKIAYQSPQFDGKKTNETISKKFSLKEYVPGKIKLVVTAVNGAGVSSTKSDTQNYIDN